LTTPLRVLQVAHGWPPERIGGVELYTHALRQGLEALGVASSAFAAAPQPGVEGPVLRVLGPEPTPTSFRATLVRPEIEAAFRAWLAIQRPDVVHFHHLTHLSLGLPRLARQAGALTVMTLHDYWLPCIRGQLVDRGLERCVGPSAQRCARCVAGQLSLEPGSAAAARLLHGLPDTWRAGLREALGSHRGAGLEAVVTERASLVEAAVRRIHRFASPSADLARRMGALGIVKDRIDHVDLPLVHSLRPSPIPEPGPVRFLFMGSMIPTKGPQLLVDAFAALPAGAATLHLVGPSPPWDLDPGFARRLAARVDGLPGATLEGSFAPGGAQARLDRADVLVLPSLWEENSPLVLREASAAGLRVVASRRGGVAELVPDARLFEPAEADGLLLALIAEIRAGRGRRSPLPWDGPEQHAGRVLAWYHRCLAER
jgi:glycosyltransferase involved in cell wall biosynthesis